MNPSQVLSASIYNTRTEKMLNATGDAKDKFLKKQYDKQIKNTGETITYADWLMSSAGKTMLDKYNKNQETIKKINDIAAKTTEILEKGKELFPNKNQAGQMTYDAGYTEEKKILGLKPMTFVLVSVALVSGVVVAYFVFKNKK